jgi:hypothetical protein
LVGGGLSSHVWRWKHCIGFKHYEVVFRKVIGNCDYVYFFLIFMKLCLISYVFHTICFYSISIDC